MNSVELMRNFKISLFRSLMVYLVSAEIGLLLTDMLPRLAMAQAQDSVKVPPCGKMM